MTHGSLHVLSLTAAKRRKREFDAVLTIEDPHIKSSGRLRFHRLPAPSHAVLRFDDIDAPQPGQQAPTTADVEAILAFGRKHAERSLLIHCLAGFGRSPAAALVILCDRLGNAGAAMEALERLRPECCPNLIITDLGDRLLGLSGTLSAAVRARDMARPDIGEARRIRASTPMSSPAMSCQPMR